MIKILFMGRKKVAADCLSSLLLNRDIEIVGVLTDSHLEGSATANVARSANLPLFTFDSARKAMDSEELVFDLGISMLYWRKLNGPFLSIPQYGTINFHPAPLPEYKGVGGYNLAILEGLDTWAATAHFVDAEIDTGRIIHEITFPIDIERETAQSLERKSQIILRNLFVETLSFVLKHPDNIASRENKGGKYLSRPELEALKLVNISTDDVDRKVRAFWFPPYDGAYIEIQGQKFSLVNRQILEELSDPSVSSLFSPHSKSDNDTC
ncbi:formyltransferase family protein [Profundibacter sp.]